MAIEKKFTNIKSLSPVIAIIEEAGKGLADKKRHIKTSDIPEVLGAVVGIGAGGLVGLGLLNILGYAGLGAAGITSGLATAGGIIGGGMVAGIGVLAAPAVVLGVGGYATLSYFKKKALKQEKETLLQEAIIKHDAVLNELNSNIKASTERMEYLNSLNILLQAAIKDLSEDLKAE